MKIVHTFIAVAALAFIISCKKDNETNPTPTPTQESKLSLITKHVFIYDSIYNNWGLSNQTVTYSRTGGGSGGWSNERVKFYMDGTFDEITTNGLWRQGTWSMNSDSSILNTAGGGFSNSVKIETLTADKLVWRDDPTHTRAVQISKK